MKTRSAEDQLAGFIAKYTPARHWPRRRTPKSGLGFCAWERRLSGEFKIFEVFVVLVVRFFDRAFGVFA
jgi:hypothetical protein